MRFLRVDEGKPPASPVGIHASETDRTYVVLSWKAPPYSSRAPMWYYIEKVTSPALVLSVALYVQETIYIRMYVPLHLNTAPCSNEAAAVSSLNKGCGCTYIVPHSSHGLKKIGLHNQRSQSGVNK